MTCKKGAAISRASKLIEKKIMPKYFDAVVQGVKTFEIRKDEDCAEVGDVLLLREWDGEHFTGRKVKREITYILRGCPEYGLMDGYAIYGLQPIAEHRATVMDIAFELGRLIGEFVTEELPAALEREQKRGGDRDGDQGAGRDEHQRGA